MSSRKARRGEVVQISSPDLDCTFADETGGTPLDDGMDRLEAMAIATQQAELRKQMAQAFPRSVTPSAASLSAVAAAVLHDGAAATGPSPSPAPRGCGASFAQAANGRSMSIQSASFRTAPLGRIDSRASLPPAQLVRAASAAQLTLSPRLTRSNSSMFAGPLIRTPSMLGSVQAPSALSFAQGGCGVASSRGISPTSSRFAASSSTAAMHPNRSVSPPPRSTSAALNAARGGSPAETRSAQAAYTARPQTPGAIHPNRIASPPPRSMSAALGSTALCGSPAEPRSAQAGHVVRQQTPVSRSGSVALSPRRCPSPMEIHPGVPRRGSHATPVPAAQTGNWTTRRSLPIGTSAAQSPRDAHTTRRAAQPRKQAVPGAALGVTPGVVAPAAPGAGGPRQAGPGLATNLVPDVSFSAAELVAIADMIRFDPMDAVLWPGKPAPSLASAPVARPETPGCRRTSPSPVRARGTPAAQSPRDALNGRTTTTPDYGLSTAELMALADTIRSESMEDVPVTDVSPILPEVLFVQEQHAARLAASPPVTRKRSPSSGIFWTPPPEAAEVCKGAKVQSFLVPTPSRSSPRCSASKAAPARASSLGLRPCYVPGRYS